MRNSENACKSPFSKLSELVRDPFVSNVTVVASGTAAAQVIAMAFAPLITRIYGAEAFGLLGVFNALVAILAPVAALTYPIAIVLPKEDREARALARLSLFTAIAVSCAATVVLLVGGEWLLALLDSEIIAPYLMLVPLSMLFSALLQIAHQWLIRKKRFDVRAKIAAIQAFVLNAAKTGIGLINPVAGVLVVLSTLGNGLHAAMLWLGIRKSRSLVNTPAREEKRQTSLKKLAIEYYDFPLYRAPQLFLNAISQSLPVLMLASFFGPASAGFYTLCKTVLGMPSQLVGQAVADVFYPRITEAYHRREDLTRLILRTTIALAAVGLVPFAIVVVFGPQLFSFVFGREWITAGEYGRWLALWLFFGFLNRPSVAAIATLSIQGFFLLFELISVGARIAALAVGFFVFNTDISAVALFALTGVVLNIGLVLETLRRAEIAKGTAYP